MPLSTTELTIIAVVGVTVVVAIVVFLSTTHQRDVEERERRQREIQRGAERFAERAKRGFQPIAVKLLLQKDEYGVLEEESTLFETRAYRVYGGAGTRIGRVYVGGGASESNQRLKQIDNGTLTLTTKRLVFDGARENRALKLGDLLSVNPWSDAIEVSTQRRAKSQVFTVANPLIWASAVHAVAAGKLSVQTDSAASGQSSD
jgi:hypothetical protein